MLPHLCSASRSRHAAPPTRTGAAHQPGLRQGGGGGSAAPRAGGGPASAAGCTGGEGAEGLLTRHTVACAAAAALHRGQPSQTRSLCPDASCLACRRRKLTRGCCWSWRGSTRPAGGWSRCPLRLLRCPLCLPWAAARRCRWIKTASGSSAEWPRRRHQRRSSSREASGPPRWHARRAAAAAARARRAPAAPQTTRWCCQQR